MPREPLESTASGLLAEIWDRTKHKDLPALRGRICSVCRSESQLFLQIAEEFGYNVKLEKK